MQPSVLFRKLRSAKTRLRQALLSQRFGVAPSTIYDDAFYDGPGCAQGKAGAAAVAAVLHERFKPKSMFDFGCGTAGILEAMAARGVEAFGCEGSEHAVRRCSPSVVVFQADLKRPVHLNRKFELVTCIEVAEHLPKRCEGTLVQSMVDASDHRIVFSASGPGQLGDDHINLQPPEHWARLFEAHGYRWLRDESRDLRRAFEAAQAPHWFQNAIVLER